jgi:hypothetical protein
MIYFLSHVKTGLLKIGTTVQFGARLASLRGEYGALQVVGLMEGNKEVERALHSQFAYLHVYGELEGQEWFRPDTALLDYIQQNASGDFSKYDVPPRQLPVVDVLAFNGNLINMLPMIVMTWLVDNPTMSITKLAQMAMISPATHSIMLRTTPRVIDLDVVKALQKVIGFECSELCIDRRTIGTSTVRSSREDKAS